MQRILTTDVPSRVGETVRLAGWVHTLRTFREVKFLVLRDRSGLVQTVVDPGSTVDISTVGKEYCVDLVGKVAAEPRAPGPRVPSGQPGEGTRCRSGERRRRGGCSRR